MIKVYPGIIKLGQDTGRPVADVVVIIALYNQGQYVREAVESIFLNSNHPKEVVIVDDKSTDESAVKAFDIIAEFKNKLPDIKLICNAENNGLAGARNVGIKATKASWLICLDADDKLEKNYIETMVKLQNMSKCDILYTDAELFGEEKGRILWPHFDPLILRTRNICFANSLFSREVFNKCGGYDTKFKHGLEDYALWLEALRNGFKFGKNEFTGFYYRRHKASMSGTNIFKKHKTENRILLHEKFGGFYLGRG